MPSLLHSNEAFVTLVTNSEYGLGAAVLGHRLRTVGTTRARVVMVTDSVPDDTRKMLSKTWDIVLDVNEMDSNDSNRLAMLKRPELGVTFSKLNIWKLTQYRKVVFVDADTLPICNIDDLFDYDELSACRDAGWPDCFNTGLFVARPSLDTYNALLRRACEDGSFDGGDQGLLNVHFNTWSHGDMSRHIPFTYNVNPNASYTYQPAYEHFAEQVKMVHFLGAVKPWHYQYADGQVRGSNLTDSTRQYLNQWYTVAETVKKAAATTTPGYAASSGQGSSHGTPMPSKRTATPPPPPTTVDQDVKSVVSHITSQILNKEQAKHSKY